MKGLWDLQRRVVLVVLGLQLLKVGRAEALRFVHVARKVSACQPTIAQDVCRTTLASQQLLSEPHALVLGLDQTRLGEGAYRRERERACHVRA